MTTTKPLSEKAQLIKGWENRIKHHQKQLAKTKDFHRSEEAKLEAKIKMERTMLSALKRK